MVARRPINIIMTKQIFSSAAYIAARIILATAAAVRWLHQRTDTLTTGAALIAGAAAIYLISTGA